MILHIAENYEDAAGFKEGMCNGIQSKFPNG